MKNCIKTICPHCSNELEVNIGAYEEPVLSNMTVQRLSSYRNSWREFADIIRSGYSYRVISVGDTVSFYLKNGNKIAFRAVAENPYDDNSIVFVSTDCYESYKMNDTSTNRGGWAKSKLRKHLNEDILPLFPDELVDVIKEREITQVINGQKYSSLDKLWVPSHTEVAGFSEAYKDIDSGDVHFEYFQNDKQRVMCLDNSPMYWWERSPGASNSTGFMYVSHGGGPGNGSFASDGSGVALSFSI